jgi:hypothetical protein
MYTERKPIGLSVPYRKMNASEVGSKDWWTVVLTMPHEEALVQLQAYRSTLVLENIGQREYQQAAAQVSKINNEIKRLNRVVDDSRWYRACKNVLDQETFDAVLMEKRMLEDEARNK